MRGVCKEGRAKRGSVTHAVGWAIACATASKLLAPRRLGASDGATVEVVVEGLVVVSGKGSRIPTVRVRRVNLRARATWSAAVACISVEINQCVGCTRQFFTKSFLSDDAGVLAPSSGEEPASPRHRAGAASIAP